jgi:L-lactate permease
VPDRAVRRTPVACVAGSIVVSGLPPGAIAALAAAPIALILVTMVVLRWSASRAGVAGLAAAAAIATAAFDVGRDTGALR